MLHSKEKSEKRREKGGILGVAISVGYNFVIPLQS